MTEEAPPTERGFPFEPGALDAPLFDAWRGNTVDPQNLESILATWELVVDGLVEQPIRWAFDDLLARARQDQTTDFHCVEGWSVLDVPWNGLHHRTLFDEVRPVAEATHVTYHSVGGVYSESLPLDVALEEHTLLAYGIANNTLPKTHGFPLRLVIPRLYGYKSAKWLERIELTNEATLGYWVSRGYPYDAEVNASRLRPGRY